MIRALFFAAFIAIQATSLFAQERIFINLVKNGDFENGYKNFTSDFQISDNNLQPGLYAVTNNAASLNPDYRNPSHGDHTTGKGYFMVIDSDDQPDKIAWRTKVNVIPNSNYTFSIYFCNIYKHKGSDNGFVINGFQVGGHQKLNDCKIKFLINGKQIGETETDIFHMFSWVKASTIWYSGNNSGTIEIGIENLNFKSAGNDLAIDDIEFSYIETMPPGWAPPQKTTIMVHEINRTKPDPKFQTAELKKDIRQRALNRTEGDSIAPEIYTIYPSKEHIASRSKKEKLPLNKVMFAQSKADLLPQSLPQLDSVANWLIANPNKRIRLEGHTDNLGDPILNIELSEARVEKIKEYLMHKGIDGGRIETIGYGGAYPLNDNSTEELRNQNRRVKIILLK